MGTSTRRHRIGHWTLLALVAVLPIACTGDAPVEDDQDKQRVQQAEVDRQLNLALADLDNEPELKDTGVPEIRRPAPPEPAGQAEASPPAPELTPEPTPEPEPAPEPEAQPAPAPEPSAPEVAEAPDAEVEPTDDAATLADAGEPAEEVRPILPSGTPFDVQLEQQLNTEWSQPGDVFMATITEPILDAEGREIIPADSEIMGEVVSVRAPDDSGRNGSIEVQFQRVFIDGKSYPIDATAVTATELKTVETKRSGPSAGSRAARGAITGAILGGLFGGKKGALIGGGAGAAASATSGGGGGGPNFQAILAAGGQLSCVVNSPFVGPPYLVRQIR